MRYLNELILIYLYETINVDYIKLSKLLFYTDSKYYMKVYRSMTELDYIAKENGPIPNFRFRELLKVKNYYIPSRKYDSSLFSKMQMDIIKENINLYKNINGDEMPNDIFNPGAWNKTWNKMKNGKIELFYNSNDESFIETMKAWKKVYEYKEKHNNFL